MSAGHGIDGFRLLVFDWDGTLVDSIGSIVGCTHATLERLGLPPVPDEVIRSMIGLGLRETVETLSPGCDEELFQRILAVYREEWVATYSQEIRPFPGVGGVLAELSGRGPMLAVATAKSRRGLRRDLVATGLEHLFAATRTVDESRSKPHPQMLLDILDEVGVIPAEALMIGDTVHDLQMAENAGVAAVAVCSGSQAREDLERESPLACLDGVGELPAWLTRRAARRGGETREQRCRSAS